MATTLLFLCIAPTASSREGGFPSLAEPVDPAGARAATRERIAARFHPAIYRSPARAAQDTADALGLEAAVEPALADMDYAHWAGRSFAGIDPAPLGEWLADPAHGAPGGETMAQVRGRIGRWMDSLARRNAPVCAITHPMVVRCALAHALDIPFSGVLAIDVAPLSRTVLSFNRTWRLTSLGSPSEQWPE